MNKLIILFLLSINSIGWAENQSAIQSTSFNFNQDTSHLIRIENANFDCAYVNLSGDTIIPFGKYTTCFDDTLKYFAAVYAQESGMIAINLKDEKLFSIFPYDNGPDYFSEGMIRIVEDDKIGYANTFGEVVINPIYSCAYPFENGRAQVAINCIKTVHGEYTFWESTEWISIDTVGNLIAE